LLNTCPQHNTLRPVCRKTCNRYLLIFTDRRRDTAELQKTQTNCKNDS
jgi:hypothetical protein